jgi:hypothetical protein
MDWDHEERERAIREADRLKAEFELDEWRRAQGAKQSQRQRQAGELVYKTYGQQPQQQEQIADLSPAVQRRWDAWFDARFDARVQKWVGHKSRLFNAMAEAFSLFREEERKHMGLREEIAGLRIDTVVGRSVLRGEINDLMKKKTRA